MMIVATEDYTGPHTAQCQEYTDGGGADMMTDV